MLVVFFIGLALRVARVGTVAVIGRLRVRGVASATAVALAARMSLGFLGNSRSLGDGCCGDGSSGSGGGIR